MQVSLYLCNAFPAPLRKWDIETGSPRICLAANLGCEHLLSGQTGLAPGDVRIDDFRLRSSCSYSAQDHADLRLHRQNCLQKGTSARAPRSVTGNWTTPAASTLQVCVMMLRLPASKGGESAPETGIFACLILRNALHCRHIWGRFIYWWKSR
jgi:hypothetical protein